MEETVNLVPALERRFGTLEALTFARLPLLATLATNRRSVSSAAATTLLSRLAKDSDAGRSNDCVMCR